MSATHLTSGHQRRSLLPAQLCGEPCEAPQELGLPRAVHAQHVRQRHSRGLGRVLEKKGEGGRHRHRSGCIKLPREGQILPSQELFHDSSFRQLHVTPSCREELASVRAQGVGEMWQVEGGAWRWLEGSRTMQARTSGVILSSSVAATNCIKGARAMKDHRARRSWRVCGARGLQWTHCGG